MIRKIFNIKDFSNKNNCDPDCICKLLNGTIECHNGFYRQNYNFNKKVIKILKLEKDGQEFTIKNKRKFEKDNFLPKMIIQKLINGILDNYKGFKIKEIIFTE